MSTATATLHATQSVQSIPRNADGPVFSAPWEAEAFALAVSLNERGLFTWKEWAATLGDEIKKAQPPAIPIPARPTITIGWRRSNASSPLKASPTRRSWRARATPGTTPARARRTARRSSYARKTSARRIAVQR